MFDVAPGKEEEFRYLERALALSDWLDRLIEATEPLGQSEPVPVLTAAPNLLSVSSQQRDSGRDIVWDRIYVDEKLQKLEQERLARRAFVAMRQREAGAIVRAARAAGRPRGLRAGFASRLARIALILHREAATDAGLQPRTESPR
ncbi:MAG: hypothetical protein IIA91_03905 [Chloroflexi bacterium]|nr:hypothetical protein [Chloroflexota bacterium]